LGADVVTEVGPVGTSIVAIDNVAAAGRHDLPSQAKTMQAWQHQAL
jgi:hypothetical protein